MEKKTYVDETHKKLDKLQPNAGVMYECRVEGEMREGTAKDLAEAMQVGKDMVATLEEEKAFFKRKLINKPLDMQSIDCIEYVYSLIPTNE